MTAKTLKIVSLDPAAAGFILSGDHTYSWDVNQVKPSSRQVFPWRIAEWTLEGQAPKLVEKIFKAELNWDILKQNCHDLLKDRFPTLNDTALRDDRTTGFWLLFEFIDQDLEVDQSRIIEQIDLQGIKLPHGLVGIHINLVQALGHISVFMTDHFFLGNTPGAFLAEFAKFFTKAIFGEALSEQADFNSYVTTVEVETVRKKLLELSLLPSGFIDEFDTKSRHSAGPFQAAHLSTAQQSWFLSWSQKHELPEISALPIEVLEQKEVARRFQRLDELMVLGDFEAARVVCSEFLAQYPLSLYLVRRWAFLSLWAEQSFSKKQLDLMQKFDPSNLMTISLGIRLAQEERSPDRLLDSLSKLGNALGQAISDFGEIDITSLTLPEMLGDAWNQKGDHRAVACYERVLHARGEIPRILVKLIRLMREVEDANSEESYIDRLLSCDVSIRTRAAIYFRLAEIKQVDDLSEAARWALMSWQTNRSQVRYALLAAEILIALQRAHEAIHVLIESSEILGADAELADRQDLEIKIADIWLHELSRSDLARERMDRAFFMAENRLDAMNQLALMAEEIADHGFLAEVLCKALDLTQAQEDEKKAEPMVYRLLALVPQLTDVEQIVRVYKKILSSRLLQIEQIEKILRQPELKLPYAEILESLNAQLADLEDAGRNRLLLLMGDVAKQHLAHITLAESYYEQAIAYGPLSEQAFAMLDAAYAVKGQNRKRYELMKSRLQTVGDKERKIILRELYFFDEVVSDLERDQFAVEILRIDPDDMGPIEERMTWYKDHGRSEPIYQLVETLTQYVSDRDMLVYLLRRALHRLHEVGDAKSFTLIDLTLGHLQVYGMEAREHAELALSYLWGDPSKQYVRSYLEYILAQGELPEFEPQHMLEVLAEDQHKVKLLLRLAFAAGDPARAIAYQRQALSICQNLAELTERKLEILERLAERCPLSFDELLDYIHTAQQLAKTDHILIVIGQQIPMADSELLRENLFQVCCEQLGLAGAESLGLDKIHRAIDVFNPEQQEALRGIWLERIDFDPELHSREFGLKMLGDKNFWHNKRATAILLKNAIESWHEPGFLRAIVPAILKNFMMHGNDSELRFYLGHLLPTGVLTYASSLSAFEYFARQMDIQSAERCWSYCLDMLQGAEETQGFLEVAQRCLGSDSGHNFPMMKIAELVELNKLVRLPVPVQIELRIFYAQQLLSHSEEHRKALIVFEQVYASDLNESRSFGPLILLYREFSADTDLYELLHRILPRLRYDSQLLLAYGIGLSSLEQEYLSISERLGLRTESTEVGELPRDPLASKQPEFGSPVADIDLDFALADIGEKAVPQISPFEESTNITENLFAPEASLVNSARQKTELSYSRFVYDRNAGPAATQTSLKASRAEPVHVAQSGPGEFSLLDEDELASSAEKFEQDRFDKAAPLATPLVSDQVNDASPFRAPVDQFASADFPAAEPPELPAAPIRDDADDFDDVLPAVPLELEADERIRTIFEVDEWRMVASRAQATEGLCQWLLDHPLDEKTEHHLAVQIAALFEEKVSLLADYPYSVWRSGSAFFYELKWSDRMGREMFHPGIKIPLAKLLRTLRPIFVQQHAAYLSQRGVAERLKISVPELLKHRKLLEWSDDLIQRSGLRFYVKFLSDQGYHVYNLPRLGERFQFDLENNELYIDREFYLKAPPSHFFHRLAFLIRAVSLDYYAYLQLNPTHEIYPFLLKCRRSLELNRVDSVKRLLGMDKETIRLTISPSDRDSLEQLFVDAGSITPEKLIKMNSVYIDQIYRLNVAESIDVIGLVESISSTDLSQPQNSPLKLISQSTPIRNLVAFAAELKFKGKVN